MAVFGGLYVIRADKLRTATHADGSLTVVGCEPWNGWSIRVGRGDRLRVEDSWPEFAVGPKQ